MQQLVDNTSVKNDIPDLTNKLSIRLSKSLDRLENAVLNYCTKKEQVRDNLVEELDGYIEQLKTVIDVEKLGNANS